MFRQKSFFTFLVFIFIILLSVACGSDERELGE